MTRSRPSPIGCVYQDLLKTRKSLSVEHFPSLLIFPVSLSLLLPFSLPTVIIYFPFFKSPMTSYTLQTYTAAPSLCMYILFGLYYLLVLPQKILYIYVSERELRFYHLILRPLSSMCVSSPFLLRSSYLFWFSLYLKKKKNIFHYYYVTEVV